MSGHRVLMYHQDYPDEDNNTIPVIDISSEMVISPSPSLLLMTPPYIPRTLHGPSDRYRILPACPTSIYNNQPPLLLPNVPSVYTYIYLLKYSHIY